MFIAVERSRKKKINSKKENKSFPSLRDIKFDPLNRFRME